MSFNFKNIEDDDAIHMNVSADILYEIFEDNIHEMLYNNILFNLSPLREELISLYPEKCSVINDNYRNIQIVSREFSDECSCRINVHDKLIINSNKFIKFNNNEYHCIMDANVSLIRSIQRASWGVNDVKCYMRFNDLNIYFYVENPPTVYPLSDEIIQQVLYETESKINNHLTIF